MNTEIKNGAERTGTSSKYRIGKKNWRKIRLAMGIILLAVVTIAVLFIYRTLLSRDDSEAPTEALSAPVISQDQIQLPEWTTESLLTINEFSRPGEALDEITGFVVHYTGNPGTTAEQNRSYFEGLATTGETYASSNFIIDMSGEILLCVPMDEVAYASNRRNSNTLSIEVCHPDETGEFTKEAYDSLIRLLCWLCGTYGISPDTIIRHGDIVDKACPLYYMEHPDAWERLLDDVKNAEITTG